MSEKPDEFQTPSFISFTSPIKDEFVKKSQAMKTSGLQLSKGDMLQLYGLFKQTIHGDNTTERPGMFSLYEGSKWDAWSGNRGKSQEKAADEYITLANRFL